MDSLFNALGFYRMKTRQVNFVFGTTLEISTTLNDKGAIIAQEIVSSGPDALITFRIDGESALTPTMLRELADRIEGPKKPSVEDDEDYEHEKSVPFQHSRGRSEKPQF